MNQNKVTKMLKILIVPMILLLVMLFPFVIENCEVSSFVVLLFCLIGTAYCYSIINKCPNCKQFSRSGPLDSFYPYNRLGLFSSLTLKRCLKCNSELD